MPSHHESLINRSYHLNLESSLRVQFFQHQSQQNIYTSLVRGKECLFEEKNPRLEEEITKHGINSVINSFCLN